MMDPQSLLRRKAASPQRRGVDCHKGESLRGRLRGSVKQEGVGLDAATGASNRSHWRGQLEFWARAGAAFSTRARSAFTWRKKQPPMLRNSTNG